ncbi:MAG: bifunctional pyr operon transcriptional regulator/uracil phosphoribosyltransferase PyrR [Elusimicrobiota bacterium]|jgi:pyrimidine operon attenuation protein/uracil phosphoribosyltransferase|nr:bifunctional pyr operon transcriptional regulator/uracil phosphoribosyltransferase PyrR [Elusimicrobiota bacterium]
MEKTIQTAQEMDKTLQRMAFEILERHANPANIAFVGIRTRGVFLAQRLKEKFDAAAKLTAPLGELDITLYRDDLSQVADFPVIKPSNIGFDLKDKNVILVDDVLYTGRTIRAALTELADFGRPATIELAVLIDRGHRELPVEANYVGKKVPTARKEVIHVKVKEYDGHEIVLLGERDVR